MDEGELKKRIEANFGNNLEMILREIPDLQNNIKFAGSKLKKYALGMCFIKIDLAKKEFPNFDDFNDIISGNARAQAWFINWFGDSS